MDNNKIEITLKKKKYTAVFLDEFRALQLFITKNIILYLCERTRYINKKRNRSTKYTTVYPHTLDYYIRAYRRAYQIYFHDIRYNNMNSFWPPRAIYYSIGLRTIVWFFFSSKSIQPVRIIIIIIIRASSSLVQIIIYTRHGPRCKIRDRRGSPERSACMV